MSGIKITLLGGASNIGASATFMEVSGHNLLIDCGVRFDAKAPLPNLDQLSGKRLDAVLVTHGHSDHTGALPVIHSSFPATPIFMTPPTFELVKILQKDALKLMDMACKQEGELPLYQPNQVESMLAQVRPVHHLDAWKLGDLEIRFLPASHIIGASMIHITTSHGRVLFTGDFSVTAQKTVPALDRPPFPVDLLVTEATYGSRLHSDRKTAEAALVAGIGEVVMNGGRVLIPCFAIGRAQEILLIVRQAMQQQKLPKIPVFVDGMVRYVCNIYSSFDRYVSRTIINAGKSGHVFYDQYISPITTPEQRRRVLEASPCIIIASSGMLSGGPSAFYATHLAPCPGDAIFITGYQDEESPGRALLDLAENHEQEQVRTIQINGESVEVRCRFATYSLSAHADRMQICGLASAFRPKTIVLVHGDSEAKQSLKTLLPCPDVEIGWDGLSIERSYRGCRSSQSPAEIEVSHEQVQSLIGEEPGPFKVMSLADALFGRRISRQELAVFAATVETTGLLKRDDNRRSLFKRVKEPLQPEPAEASKRIKQQNPKGQLNELCQKNQLPYPEKRLIQKEDGLYYCLLNQTIAGQILESSHHCAQSKMIAEQLAAQEMLALLTDYLANANLAESTPKASGEDQKDSLSRPKRQQSEDADTGQGKEYAEQGGILDSPPPTTELPIDPRAKSAINNYRQNGLVSDFRCRVIAKQGPSHAPIFVMQAEATLEDGSIIASQAVSAATKKTGEALAATALLMALNDSPAFGQLQRERQLGKQQHMTKTAKPDESLVNEVVKFLQASDINHHCRLPFRYLKQLAKQILMHDKIADEEWIEQNLDQCHRQWEEQKIETAHQNGYYPFVQLNQDIYQAIDHNYSRWVIDLMQNHLDDPTRIFPGWAAQFAATAAKIGQNECQKHLADLYRFVTSHNYWEECARAREKLMESLATARRQKLYQRFAGGQEAK